MSDPTIPEAPGATLTGHAHLFRDDRLAVFRSLAATGELATIRFLHRSVVFANTPRAARGAAGGAGEALREVAGHSAVAVSPGRRGGSSPPRASCGVGSVG
jgi:hypothetical protein